MNSDPCHLNDAINELVSLVGLSEEMALILVASGYYSVADVCQASTETLRTICGVTTEVAETVLASARKQSTETSK